MNNSKKKRTFDNSQCVFILAVVSIFKRKKKEEKCVREGRRRGESENEEI
jgi:hypothetical protein